MAIPTTRSQAATMIGESRFLTPLIAARLPWCSKAQVFRGESTERVISAFGIGKRKIPEPMQQGDP
jgi:hypothetical protein